MRIAVWHNLLSGGGYRALCDQVRGLLARGHHVEVWCPDNAERNLIPIDTFASAHRLPLACRAPKPARTVAGSAVGHLNHIRQSLRALADHVGRCANEIHQGRFDVLLAHPSSLFYMHPLARFTRIPSVLYLQEVYRPIHEARPHLPWEALPGRARILGGVSYWMEILSDMIRIQGDRILLREERRAAREWDAILCNSRFSRESIVRAYAIDARVCYLGVDTESFSVGSGPRDYFLGLGSLDCFKAAHLAIQAISLLPASRRIPLRWVGNYANPGYQRVCEDLAQRTGVDFSCEIRVDEATLRHRLQGAIALLYPSILEPFGYAPLEANACGTPVVAVAEAGIRETVQDGVNGLLVDDRRPESFSRALARLLAEKGLAERLGSQGAALVRERWTLESASIRLEQELLDAHTRGRRSAAPSSVYEAGNGI